MMPQIALHSQKNPHKTTANRSSPVQGGTADRKKKNSRTDGTKLALSHRPDKKGWGLAACKTAGIKDKDAKDNTRKLRQMI